MLTIDPAPRLSMAAVAAHRWFAAKEGAARGQDEDGDGPVYRSVAGEEDDDAVPFELPEMAPPISRQRARMQVSGMPDMESLTLAPP